MVPFLIDFLIRLYAFALQYHGAARLLCVRFSFALQTALWMRFVHVFAQTGRQTDRHRQTDTDTQTQTQTRRQNHKPA